MNYIRTKYEILSNSRPVIEDEDCVLTDQRGWIKKHSVVKQSDNIKELCDEYVWDKDLCIIDFDKRTLSIKGDSECYEFDLDWCLKNHPIYGAIWIKGDKGEPILKSVAKLHNEGDLELL